MRQSTRKLSPFLRKTVRVIYSLFSFSRAFRRQEEDDAGDDGNGMNVFAPPARHEQQQRHEDVHDSLNSAFTEATRGASRCLAGRPTAVKGVDGKWEAVVRTLCKHQGAAFKPNAGREMSSLAENPEGSAGATRDSEIPHQLPGDRRFSILHLSSCLRWKYSGRV